MPKLGVNIDHVATLRQARREGEPDPVLAAKIAQNAGAQSIVAHLREDRRHIQDKDIRALKKIVRTRFNMEMSIHPDIVNIACNVKPDQATLVPERRQEITTEGGLDVIRYFQGIKKATGRLQKRGITVSLFIDPDEKQILKASQTGARMLELHTGTYARARTKSSIDRELARLRRACSFAGNLGFKVSAGHGLNYTNTRAIAAIPEIEELNIGHSIISRAVFVGLEKAVKEMLRLCK